VKCCTQAGAGTAAGARAICHDGAVRAQLTVAAVQPACAASDVAANAGSHAAAVRSSRSRLVVFPELSLTGYELDAQPVPLGGGLLHPIIDACGDAGSVALVGAPVEVEGARFIAMLRVDGAGVEVAYRKTWLGGTEPDRFAPGDGPTVLELDGWRLGLGICKDTGAAQHTAGTAALGIDAYVAGLVHRPEELPEQKLGRWSSRAPAEPSSYSRASLVRPGTGAPRLPAPQPSGHPTGWPSPGPAAKLTTWPAPPSSDAPRNYDSLDVRLSDAVSCRPSGGMGIVWRPVLARHDGIGVMPLSPSVHVREMQLDDVAIRIDYFHDASDDHLRLLGVDRGLLPSRAAWKHFYEVDYARPIGERANYSLIWELDGEVVGFSSTDQITFGEQAFMHLHILDPTRRNSGMGTQFVKESAVIYLRVLDLRRLFCQPNSFNVAPNRTLQRAGFRYLLSEHTTPSAINFPQVVTRLVLERTPQETGPVSDPSCGHLLRESPRRADRGPVRVN